MFMNLLVGWILFVFVGGCFWLIGQKVYHSIRPGK